MTIRFNMQLADTLACVRHYLKSDKGARKAMLWYRVMVPLIWAILLIPDVAHGRTNIAIAVIGVVTSVGWWFGAPALYVRLVVRQAKKAYGRPENEKLFGNVEMTLEEDGVKVKKSDREAVSSWSNITKAAKSADYIFLHLSNVSMIAIPRRDLSEQEWHDVEEIVKKQVPDFQVAEN